VKTYRARATGELRLWFKPGEIDDWMEVELRKANLYPTADDPVVDIERFVDRHLGVDLEQYAPLKCTVLGETRFEPGKKPKILINKSLTEIAVDEEDVEPWLRSKWRMTMAHEATHVLLHRGLYPSDDSQQMLFSVEDDNSSDGQNHAYQCLEKSLDAPGRGDWREVQANKGMAALLMPKSLFLVLYQAERERMAADSKPLLKGSPEASRIAKTLGRLFDVSVQSVEIRIQELNLFANPGQVQLL